MLAAENKGIAHNVNRALQSLEGDYLIIFAGDDFMYPAKVEQQVRYLDFNADVIACAHDMDVFDSSKGQVTGRFSNIYSKKQLKGKVASSFCLTAASMYRPARSCIDAILFRSETLA